MILKLIRLNQAKVQQFKKFLIALSVVSFFNFGSLAATGEQLASIDVIHIKDSSQGRCITTNIHIDMLRQVNQIRSQGALCGEENYPPAKPLRWSKKLQQAADKHSLDMATHNFFNHKSASSGSTLPQRLRSADYNYQTAGENIAAGPVTVAQVVAMWVASPAHCATMMNIQFTELGVSCKHNNNTLYKTYWTLKAATPL